MVKLEYLKSILKHRPGQLSDIGLWLIAGSLTEKVFRPGRGWVSWVSWVSRLSENLGTLPKESLIHHYPFGVAITSGIHNSHGRIVWMATNMFIKCFSTVRRWLKPA